MSEEKLPEKDPKEDKDATTAEGAGTASSGASETSNAGEHTKPSDKTVDQQSEASHVEPPQEAVDEVAATKSVHPEEETSSEQENTQESSAAVVDGESTEERSAAAKLEAPGEEPDEPGVDYDQLGQEELIGEMEKLIASGNIAQIKERVELIRKRFNDLFQQEMEIQQEAFLAEGGNPIDFRYTAPLKKKFNSLYFDYKEKRAAHFKSIKQNLQANLERRLELIEAIKSLLTAEENIGTTYKQFKEIQDEWHSAGPIPRDNYDRVWKTYRHHVENFYDFLHLNREFRDLDFKHNLEDKLRIIQRAEELVEAEDAHKAFRELQQLHKVWKEEIGPVAKEHRETLWNSFSELTKKIRDRRDALIAEQEAHLEANVGRKMAIIDEINSIRAATKPSHSAWRKSIDKVQQLRDTFFEIGSVPRAKNKEIWEAFKASTREFNREKNNFYKSQKKDQLANLEKKRELVRIAEEHKDSDDFETVTPLMKKIQNDWKAIGHVPRKDSDTVWKAFKAACNHYFDRVHNKKNAVSEEEMAHLEAKQALLDEVAGLKIKGEREADLEMLKEKIEAWKAIGRVPVKKRKIEQQFNKALDKHFSAMDLTEKEAEMFRFEHKLNAMLSAEDEEKIRNEAFFLRKKVDEVKAEIRQLENNLGFFQHVPDDNPLVKEVHQKIAKQRQELEVWKTKLATLRQMTR
jgi:hypothetical protein